MRQSLYDVCDYWNLHLNGTQFLDDRDAGIGTEQCFDTLEEYIKKHHGYKDRLLAEFAENCKGKELLEVGCGLGLELVHLARLGFHVTGIDLAPKAVEVAGSYLKRLGLGGRTMVQNAEEMKFQDGSFDAIYSSGVLQHTPHIRRAIGEMMRVLRPGGRMLIIVYHRHSWFYLIHRLSGENIEFPDREAPIVNAYTKEQVRDLFGKLRNLTIRCEYCYPMPTKRSGRLARAYNNFVVPTIRVVPHEIMRHFGWHLIITGVK